MEAGISGKRQPPGAEIALESANDIFQILLALKSNRRKRSELGQVFVEGVAPIKVALESGWEAISMCYAAGRSLSDWAKSVIAANPGAQRYRLSPALMEELSDKDEPSEIILCLRRPAASLAQIKPSPGLFCIVLDRSGSPGNLGSILRSAEAFGAQSLILLGHGADPFDPLCIRASLGAVFSLQLVREPSMEDFEAWLEELRSKLPELSVLGTDSGGELDFEDAPLRPPLVLMFGNEAKGLSVRLKGLCDSIVSLAMRGTVNSLNIACAASIFIHRVASSHARAKRSE